MPPRPESRSAIARLRSATTAAASASERPPATQAAAIWAGATPAARQTSASATIIAKDAGCTTSTRSREGAPGAPATTSSRDHPVNGSSASAHSRIRAANTGDSAISSAPMPAHCAPWPGKTNTTRSVASVRPVTTFGAGSPAARASSRATASAWSAARTTARSGSAARVVARARATSVRSRSGRPARKARSRSA